MDDVPVAIKMFIPTLKQSHNGGVGCVKMWFMTVAYVS